MTKTRAALVLSFLLVLAARPACAFDAAQTFRKGGTVLSIEGGGGSQENLEGHRVQTGLDLWYLGLRYSLLPFAPAGPGVLRGSFEIGLEPVYVNYFDPVDAFFAGLGFRARWHFLSLGRFVPYLEGGGAVGGTDLEVREVDSSFAFLLSLGAGASVFLTDRMALYAGYRLVHVSNGGIESPNRGFEAHTGVLGLSYYFK